MLFQLAKKKKKKKSKLSPMVELWVSKLMKTFCNLMKMKKTRFNNNYPIVSIQLLRYKARSCVLTIDLSILKFSSSI
jgi:hypothetical protein